MADRTCVECGAPVTGRSKILCGSKTCRNRRNKRSRDPEGRKRDRERARVKVERSCKRCGATFVGVAPSRVSNGGKVYCSEACRHEAMRRRNRRRWPQSPIRIVPCAGGCGDLRTKHGPGVNSWTCACCSARPEHPTFQCGHCRVCGSSFITAWNGRPSFFCSRRCARYDSKARRRVRLRANYVAPVNRLRIFERDDWTCQLCGFPVERDAVLPDYEAPVIDHVIPLAKGGTHEPANVQTAHFLCNSYKSDTLPTVAA